MSRITHHGSTPDFRTVDLKTCDSRVRASSNCTSRTTCTAGIVAASLVVGEHVNKNMLWSDLVVGERRLGSPKLGDDRENSAPSSGWTDIISLSRDISLPQQLI
jgi:hypothetical protein